MTLLTIAGVYYQFFVHAEKYMLSYIKIKQIRKELMDRHPYEIDKRKVDDSFYLLLYLGLIDRTNLNGKMAYHLTQSTIIYGVKRSILIHYAMSTNNMKYLGLNYDIIDVEGEIAAEEIFNPISILKVVPKISSIIKARFTYASAKQTFKYLEKWSPSERYSNGAWVETNDFELKTSLYKRYSINNQYYDYCFWFKGNFHDFTLDDLVTLQLVQSFLLISSRVVAFKYDDERGVLNEFLPLLEPVKKVLFTHHILSTGDIPMDKGYLVDGGILKQLKRIYT